MTSLEILETLDAAKIEEDMHHMMMKEYLDDNECNQCMNHDQCIAAFNDYNFNAGCPRYIEVDPLTFERMYHHDY